MRSLIWVWIDWVKEKIDGGSYFRARMILGTILVWFLAFHICVPRCPRNGSELCLYQWVPEIFVYYRQSTKNTGFPRAEFLGRYFSDPVFYLLGDLGYIFLIDLRNGRVSWLALLRLFFLGFCCNGAQLPLVSQCCHILKEKSESVVKTKFFCLLAKLESIPKVWFFKINN